jgi:hypothetical protein
MRRGLIALLALFGVFALAPTAQAAEPSSGVRGSVLDTTCIVGCASECPPPPVCRATQPCVEPQARIVCPLAQRAAATYPPYDGTAATVILRKAGSAKVLGRLPVVSGKFTAHLSPGRYVVRAHVSEPCWTGTRQVVEVVAGRFIPVVLRVGDACAAQPGEPPLPQPLPQPQT